MSEQTRAASSHKGAGHALALAAILGAGLAIRLLLAPHGVYAGDAQTFRAWATRLMTVPLSHFYSTTATTPAPGGFNRNGNGVIDHLPGDLWLLWALAHIYRWFAPGLNVQRASFLFLLKLVPALADLGVAALLYLIARRLAGPRAGLLAAAFIAFNPASIFLTATWGQWDSVSACVMLLALWLVVRGDAAWALPALTYASLIKPQMALLFPLVVLAWWRGSPRPVASWSRRVGELLAAGGGSLGVFLAVDLPFSVGLPLLPTSWTIFGRVSVALDKYRAISENAFNLWGVVANGRLMADDSERALFGLSYHAWGIGLLTIALLGSLALYWRRPDAEMVLWAAGVTMFAAFMLPTRIHERYLLPAVVLLALLAALAPALRWVGVALSLTYLINLDVVYQRARSGGFGAFGQPSARLTLCISAINLFLFLVVCGVGVALTRRAPERAAEPAAQPQLAAGATLPTLEQGTS